jgi:hypothetical protein
VPIIPPQGSQQPETISPLNSPSSGDKVETSPQPQPALDPTSDSEFIPAEESESLLQPPSPSNPGAQAPNVLPRTIVSIGISECVLDQFKQTIANVQLADYATSATRKAPHPPEIATEGQADFTMIFTSSSPNFRVNLLKSWNLDDPKMVGNTTFTFVETDFGNAPGATFIFYGIESCINGVMTPPVNVDVKASLYGANIPIKAIN